MFIRRTFTLNIRQCWLVSRKRYCTSVTEKMQNVYIRFTTGVPTFNVSFLYHNEAWGIERKFNFNRQSEETVGWFLSRVTQNVQKFVTSKIMKKKKKKKKKKASSETDIDEVKFTVDLLKCGKIVSPEDVMQDVLQSGEMLTLSLNGRTYNVVINCPWIDALKLPSCILSGFPVYPCEFVGDSVEKLDSQFVWYKSKLQNQWEEVGSGFMYTPKTEDIGYYLKLACEPRKGQLSGPVEEATSLHVVEAGPGTCPFEMRHAFTQERAEGESFRVTSYNILAGMYSETDESKTDLYPYCPPYALSIDYRKQLILKEILGYKSDIICLQEVDEKIFEADLEPILSFEKYCGVYNRKGNGVREGLACFVNSIRFRIIESHVSLLCSEVSERQCYRKVWDQIKENEPLLNRIRNKSTTTQATVLQSVESPNNLVVVGNTHLYFHPDADHIRLMQGGLSMLFLEDIIKKIAQENPAARVSLIFCGDFNSTPDCGIYRLMTSGHVPDDVIDWKSKKDEAISQLSLTQPFYLESACGTPQYTNFTVGFADCLDYIFYQTDCLKLKQVIPLYSEEELKRYVALPNVVFPSDHVALVADLSFVST